MSDAGYVFGGWLVVGTVLSGYTAWLVVRLRRAERSFTVADPRPPARAGGRTTDDA
jgi:hypothetical protein